MAKNMTDLMYSYTKLRINFGRQPIFCETPAVLLDTYESNIWEQNQYCLRNPVNRDTQTSIFTSIHDVNTKRIIIQDQGINHTEGGWPKDINYTDEELTTRFERDEAYVETVLSQYPEFVHYIDQNNAIEMYNMYFKDMPPQEPVETSHIRMNNIFKDPSNRPISCIGWTYEDEPKLVVSYCDKTYPICVPPEENFSSFVWNIELPNAPVTEFCPPSSCWQIACSPVHPAIIIGGLQDGRICMFDVRASKEATSLSEMYLFHREPVTSLLYVHSRVNNEFFSGSTDGVCMWWDIRNISAPIDGLIMSIRIPQGEQMSLANAEGVSALQYDRSFPTKFLCGTETGFVINVNRKGKTHQEVMGNTFEAHYGAVKSVHRSPCTSKVFISCGDWRVNIWNEDVHTSPIITGEGQRYRISDVAWAPLRVSSYMSVGADGKIRYWDLLRRFREPVITLSISNCPLEKMKPHDDGKLIAVGDTKGALHLLSLSENLVFPGNTDKQLMIQTFERETRRAHILESRIKEIRLKVKMEGECDTRPVIDIDNYEGVLRNTEEQYRQIVSDEMCRVGVTASVGSKLQTMRKR